MRVIYLKIYLKKNSNNRKDDQGAEKNAGTDPKMQKLAKI